ncbi:MAG: GNAT family N-acetyltransferase [Lawsonibacter sp.]|jgi:probable phosphoglycerate mutase
MTTIYLIRHAEAEGNLYRRIHGWYNALVTENGFLQIQALEKRFQEIPVDAVYSSDLYRTMATARAVYIPKGLTLHTDPQLREVHMGDWEDCPWGEIYRSAPVEMAQFNHSDPAWRAPHGDSLGDLGDRVQQAITRIARAHMGETVAIFCHGTAIRQFLANVKGLSPQQWHDQPHFDNTAVTCLTFDGAAFSIRFEGDVSHLPEELLTLKRQNWWKKDAGLRDINLWFRPLDWEKERDIYLEARRDAWTCTHIHGPEFLPEGFLQDAQEHLSHSPWGVTLAMDREEIAGVLQLDTNRYQQDGAGYIPFCYIVPALREHNLGVQLIGQAVSFFRPLGRDKLRLRCAPYNHRAQHFYRKYGFYKIGEEQGSRVPLDILEKYIGYER